ncbi:MAG: hypothetical protein M1840_006473 [Geoglossum simile]|nr:MAG: hypothetical protein M1840_006473 [Geoglossum simile]
MSDRLLVQNSKAMQAILQATQAEVEASRQVAIQSQRLAEKMMKDSVAMKTIALLTTFFLPGTSFAAILSMPFFNGDPWLKASNRIWIWLALTIPSTLLCFMFYLTWSHRESKRKAATAQDLELQLQNASIGNT